MVVFKKLFKKSKKEQEKKEEKKEECWYNNSHENAESNLGEPMEGGGFNANWFDMANCNKIGKK